ncbi:REDY-like protein HapK [Parasphingopyxis algicola]|uniref:REDY-like protein HapK n=1 Tax=Parasphingopyxis algicola TaxID=2026624 RepID=UPI0015A3A3E6|nr:REDY-like protein HapK [Parasphingopyxis algicola]QLC26082.1 REDY-like protein HapK [Parasphingopyxis algicola]
MRIIVLFNLKDGVSVAEYEEWAKTRDIPGVNALGSVDGFTVHKATGLFGSDAKPAYDYFEIIDVNDMDAFVADISTDEFQAAAAPFQDYADNPQFVLTEDL